MRNSGSEVDEAGQNLLDNIGAAFLQFRQEAGLTQRQVAKNADSTQARISGIENGRADIFVLTLQRWARVYGYDLEISFVPVENVGQQDFEDGLAALLEEIEEESHAEVHEEDQRASC